MKALFRKLAPFLAIFGLAALVFAVLRGKKTGDYVAQLKALFMSSIVFLCGCAAVYFLITDPGSGWIQGTIWGTIGASTTGTFTIQFVPQFIEITTANSPTLLQININGDGQCFNLDTNGLSSMTHIRAYQRQTNSFLFNIADGLLNGKNGSVTVSTGASGATIRAWSPVKNGSQYYTFNPAQALVNQSVNLQSFAYASYPSAATTDTFQIGYQDMSLDSVTREELNVYLGYYQNDTITTAKYAIDNILPARINQVTFSAGAQQTFYVMKYQSAYGQVLNANPNV